MDKEIMKMMKKVLKKEPRAKITTDLDGKFFVCVNGDDVTEEYFLPHSESELGAWERALTAFKTKQNFDRSHPLKASMADVLKKTQRINGRKIKGRINKENRQGKEQEDSFGTFF